MKVWIEGRVVAPEDAKISVLDHGLLYGDGVFEGIRCSAGRVIDWQAHLQRLRTSARAIYLDLPPVDLVQRAVFECLAALGEPDAYVRLIVTRGTGALGIDVASCERPQLICIAGQIQLYSGVGPGLRMITASLRRPAPDMLDPRVKSLNYLNQVLAKLEAKRRGGDEALLLNDRGTVAEASGANLFARLGKTVCTPPPSDGALGGITRARILTLLRRHGVPFEERSLTRFDLLDADEVFVSGTGAGIVAVESLDGQPLGASRTVRDLLLGWMPAYVLDCGTPVPGLAESSALASA